MKRLISFVMTLVLAVGLLTVLSGSALAAETDIAAVEGSAVVLQIGNASDLTDVRVMEGSLPDGLELGVSEGKLILYGVPESIGEYKVVVRPEPGTAKDELALRVRVRAANEAQQAALDALRPAATESTEPAAAAVTVAGAAGGTDATAAEAVTTAAENTTETPKPTNEPAEPTATPTPAADVTVPGPTITKNPGGETVSELGTAIFVARADRPTSITWYLVAPRGVTYALDQLGDLFPGMAAVGQDTETLTLYSIASGFNGWQVECHFTNAVGGESVSERATVTVSSTLPAAPTITGAPEDTFLVYGSKTTLAVYADAPAGNSIKYQWYSTTENDPATATAIADATTPEYIPPETDGTVYYCVGLRSVNSETVSTTAYTPLAAVTYGSEPEVPVHVHTYGETWSSDDVYHWHICLDCGEIADRSTHIYEWTETVKPTARKQGERVGVCTVCGHETRQVIQPTGSGSGKPGKGILIALLVLVIALLAAGTLYYIRFSRTGYTRGAGYNRTRGGSGAGSNPASRSGAGSTGRHSGASGGRNNRR